MSGARAHRALAAVPALLMLVGVPLVNHVRAYVLGLPFLLFWIVACVVLTSVVMAAVYALDRRAGALPPPDAAPPAGAAPPPGAPPARRPAP